MRKSPEKVVAEMGKLLGQQRRPPKDFIVKTLRQAAGALVELEQLSSLSAFIRPLTQSLINHSLLGHSDNDVRLLVAFCFSEILRVLAPHPSFDDSVFKDVFHLFIVIFSDLADTASPYFSRRLKILDTVATLQCSRRMLDLGSHHLILNLFTTFFSVVREAHPPSLTNGMLSIMSLILNEEEDTPHSLLEVILRNLTDNGEGPSRASYHLAVAVIQTCAEKVKPAICGFIMSCISDRASVSSDLKECYHEIIFEIFQCTPHMLLAIIPNLIEELVIDQVDIRIKAVSLIGKLLALSRDHDFHGRHHLFVELLKRFSDKSADVRIGVTHAVKRCYMANPSGIESHKILSCLEGRLLDLDASVRAAAVAVVCDLGKVSLKNFPENLVTRATDRLRDKMTSVRKEALMKLLELYREYCTKCYEGQMLLDKCYEQIPCKILVLSLDNNLKEFRPQNLELLLATDLFSASLSGEDRMEHWIYLYSLFTPAHVKALNLILSQKRRFQSEMREYLSLRIKEKGIGLEEVNTRTKNAFVRMSATFPNSAKVEECFCKLNQLKDTSLLFPLLQLLDEPTLLNAKIKRDKYIKNIGDKHCLFEFLDLLSLKCSNNIFSSEHIRHILDHVSSCRCKGNHIEESSFSLLSDAVRHFPLLLRDSEDKFIKLILEEDFAICEKLLLLLAKLGPSISIELSQIYPLLERLCLEGTRAQSKVSISVITASLGRSVESILVELSQKLVESLRCGLMIPTALQSLGCIFQHSVLAFQQHEKEVSSYVREIFFDDTTEDNLSADEKSQSYVSSRCKLKIYGLKTLVKSVLPKKGTHGEEQISNLMDLLSKVLLIGESPDGTLICENDKSHIRLAAAKSVLRLSRRWDVHISPHIFHSTIMMAKDASPSIRKVFIDKTYKLLKKHLASRKFACAFALAASDCVKDLQDSSLKYLVEYIKECGRAAEIFLPSSKERSMTDCPEYIVVFLLHALAHDDEFPPVDSHDEEQFAHFCRPLLLILHVLINSQHANGNLSAVNKTFLNLRSIFRAIRRAEDAVEPEKSLKLHVLADIGIFTLNLIQPDGIDFSLALGLVLLPSSLYKTSATGKRNEESCSQRAFVNEEFVRKLVCVFECDFSQVSSLFVKRGQNSVKGRVQGPNVSSGSKQTGMLRDVTTQKKIVAKEMARTHVLEACPNMKKQKNISGASVLKEFDADVSQNLEHLDQGQQPGYRSSNLELFGLESDVSLSVALDDSMRKSSSDGSNVSFLGQRDAKKLCIRDGAEAILTDSGEGTAEVQELQNNEREILVDKTNSLAVKGRLKNCKPKGCEGHQVHVETSSEISDENKDGIAYRTRRRRVN
ncbi:hypothetical protein RND81_01G227500 [Saponaria officinalis]|uniref:Sister chromatid cohesion protein PDS5 homolog A n=1 Tax=Saponaria officinalis TaxID=3572 RepID=A0AAW1NBY1_SAPOF